MARSTNAITAFVLLLWLAASLACKKNEAAAVATNGVRSDPVIDVKAAPPEVREWTVAVPISGDLRSQSVVDVKAEVGGRLLTARFEEGSLVHQGDLLAEIDPANYRLALGQASASLGVARAGVVRAQVAVDHARRENERAGNLVRSGGITERDREAASTGVKEAESNLELARAQVAQAEAAVAIAEKALKDCQVVAPEAGEVRKKFLDPGALVTPGTPLYTLVDNTRLELECLLPSYRLAEVRKGQRVSFATPSFGERLFGGTVLAINPVVESDNRSVRVTVRISNAGGELRAGMFARGEIVVGSQKQALVLPRSALVAEQEGSETANVYVVEEGRARRRAVRLGGVREDRVWVRQGLEPGETVITDIGPSLKDGAPVKVGTNPASGS